VVVLAASAAGDRKSPIHHYGGERSALT